MRILYLVHQFFPRYIGGTEIYTAGLAKRAQTAGHEVLIITCHEDASKTDASFHTEDATHQGLNIREFHFALSAMPHPARAEYDNALLRRGVEGVLRSFQPDVVHVMHAMKLSASAMQACIDSRIPVVVTLCDFWFLCPRHTLLQPDGTLCSGPSTRFKCIPCEQELHNFARPSKQPRQAIQFFRDAGAIAKRRSFLMNTLQQASRIIALSNFAKAKFVEYGIAGARIEVIPHGLETDDLQPAEINRKRAESSGPLRIGFIGSLVPHKGAHLLLGALALNPETELECLIYGPLREDEYSGTLRATAESDARVRLMGSFPPEHMGAVLRSFDVLAMPALWYENQPLVVKAAQYSGIPVLANDIGSLSEMIEEGKNGWLIRERTPRRWGEALAELASAPLQVFAPTPVKTMDNNAKEILDIYEQLTGSSS